MPADPNTTFCIGCAVTPGAKVRIGELGIDPQVSAECEAAIISALDRYVGGLPAEVSWSVRSDAGPGAACSLVSTDPLVFEIVVTGGAVTRLWATVTGVLAADVASACCDYDHDLRMQTAHINIFSFEHVSSDGFMETDAAVALAAFDSLHALTDRAQELVARSQLTGVPDGHRAHDSRVAATAVVHAVVFLVLHEVAHILRSHFSLRSNMSQDAPLRDVLVSGFELDADAYAGALLAEWALIRSDRADGPRDDAEFWSGIALGITLVIYTLEVERLRLVDASPGHGADGSVAPTPHVYDVGRLRVIFDNMLAAITLARGKDAAERFCLGVNDSVRVFTNGFYFMVAGALYADRGRPLTEEGLLRAGSLLRRYHTAGLYFRQLMEDYASDALTVFQYYRRFIVEGAWDGAIQALGDAEVAIRDIISGQNDFAPVFGIPVQDAETSARMIREDWQRALESDIDQRAAQAMVDPVVHHTGARKFVACTTSGRRRIASERCRYGCDSTV